jgi:signal peptidase I
MTVLRHIVRGTATLIMGVAVLAAVAAGLLVWAGYRPQPVLSGSMEPALPVGSLAIAKAVPASTIEKGDVITFARPGTRGETITHRVVAITEGRERRFTTRGDANPSRDPWQVQLPGQVGEHVATVPHAGYAAMLAGRGDVRAALVAFLTLLLMVSAVRAIWRSESSTAVPAS